MKRGLVVVRSHKKDGRVALPALAVQYSYDTARIDVTGRGFIGFRQVTRTDPVEGTETVTQYDVAQRYINIGHMYPLAPLPKDVWVRKGPQYRSPLSNVTGSAEWAQHTTNAYEVKLTAATGSANQQYSVLLTSKVTEEFASLTAATPVRRATETHSSWDAFGHPTSSTYATDGGTTITRTNTYLNDTDKWLISFPLRSVESRAKVASSGGLPLHTEYSYYPNGKVESIKRYTDLSRPEETSWRYFGYDTNGNVSAVSDIGYDLGATEESFARSASVSYDSEGVYPQRVKDALGHVSWLGYHGGFGTALITQDPNGIQTRIRYDGFGRQRLVVPTGAPSTSIDFEAGTATDAAFAVTHKNNFGAVESVDIDVLGRPVRQARKSFNVAWVDVALGYDELGRLATKSNPFIRGATPAVTTFAYDNLNRPVLVTNPDGSKKEFRYPTSFEDRHIDESLNETVVTRDLDGLITSTTENIKSALSGTTRTVTTSATHDAWGNPLSLKRSNGVGQVLSSYTYDGLGRISGSADPIRGITSYQWNSFGDLRSAVTPTTSRSFVHDPGGRLTQASSDGGRVDTWRWDSAEYGIGQLASSTSADGVTRVYRYDSSGRTSQSEVQFPGLTHTTDYEYDTFGRLQYIRYPSFDGSRLSVLYSYSATGYLASVKDSTATKPLWTLEIDRPTLRSERRGNDFVSQQLFDPKTGLTTDINVKGASGTPLSALRYSYSPTGDPLTRVESVSGVSETFVHDSLGRLEEWKRTGGGKDLRRDYLLDDFGNIKSVTDYNALTGGTTVAQTTYLVGVAGKVLRDESAFYDTDASGRQYAIRSRADNTKLREIVYNHHDLPAQVTLPSGTSTFLYDAEGTRANKTRGTSTTYYGDGFEDRASTTTRSRTFVYYIQAEGETVAQVSDEIQALTESTSTRTRSVAFPHRDALGSVALVSYDNAQKPVERLFYEPFGGRVALDGAGATPPASGQRRGFTDHEHDDELGLINMRGRMFDPARRRFLTPDRMVQAPYFSQGHNPFAYVLNRPLRFIDPSGWDPCTPEICDGLGPRDADNFPVWGSRDPPRNAGAHGASSVSEGASGPPHLDASVGSSSDAGLDPGGLRPPGSNPAQNVGAMGGPGLSEIRPPVRAPPPGGLPPRAGPRPPTLPRGPAPPLKPVGPAPLGEVLAPWLLKWAPVILTVIFVEGTEDQEAQDAQAALDLTGPKAMEHLRKHAQHARDAARRLGQPRPNSLDAVKVFLKSVVENGERRLGTWGDLGQVQFHRLGDAIVIRRMNGQYVTNLDMSKGGAVVDRWAAASVGDK